MSNVIKSTLKQLLMTLFVLISYAGIGQSQSIKPYADFISEYGTIKVAKNIKLSSEKKIVGTPYLFEEFFLGSVITKENIQYIDIPLRYNIFSDQFEYKTRDGGSSTVSNPSSISQISMKNLTFIYDNKGKKSGFYQTIISGNTQLLIRHNIVFYTSKDPSGVIRAQPAKFDRRNDTYYIKIADKDPLKVSKKKDLQSLFGNESKEVMAFIKKEKINARKKAHLTKLVEFINQMN